MLLPADFQGISHRHYGMKCCPNRRHSNWQGRSWTCIPWQLRLKAGGHPNTWGLVEVGISHSPCFCRPSCLTLLLQSLRSHRILTCRRARRLWCICRHVSLAFDFLDSNYLPRGPNLGFNTSTFDFVLYSVERQLRTEEMEHLSFKVLGDERFKVQKIKMSLVFDFPTNCGRKGGQLFWDGFWKIWYWERVCRVTRKYLVQLDFEVKYCLRNLLYPRHYSLDLLKLHPLPIS